MVLAASTYSFIDTALSNTGPLALSYSHTNLKWLIRDHLLALLADFPFLSPSIDTFTHDDGTTVHLLHASGPLPLPSSPSTILLTIWLHQNHPFHPPLVYISSPDIARNHPFIDPSGAVASPYIISWQYPKSNPSDLARNLINLFTFSPPFVVEPPPPPPKTCPIVSKREAIDRLTTFLHRDMASMKARADEDIEGVLGLQARLVERARELSVMERAVERERAELKRREREMEEAKGVLVNWLHVNERGRSMDDGRVVVDEVFEGGDQYSKLMIENEAADAAIEEVMYEIEPGFNVGLVNLERYMKEVRSLAREQFFVRAMLMKLNRGLY
ncbi:hypothetical protein QJS04_geneDACA021858 [Acorus gramineus]|uniref:Protein ELC-like n=1 Tax=Acorus gramineus TaxID=55184 RepID=A0AAV9AT64_ACOGR|nr:hypothetical protein QJS04_geneDACA021858 [Acorus gramineus]